MKHYDEASWIDLVRGVVSPNAKASMLQHIADGCKQCGRTMQMWQGVVAVAAEEAVNTPPSDVVRVVKSQMASVAPRKPWSLARLLFDSSLQPVMAGVRGAIPARQLLYETDELCIDLRLEVRHAHRRVSVVGQILSRAASQTAHQELPVRLYKRNQQLTQSITNQYGEFQLEFAPNDAISLAIGQEEETRITLPSMDLTV